MAEFPAISLWTDAVRIRDQLLEEGWRSPDTYCNFFASASEASAVYLFLVHDLETNFHKALVGYVGMAKCLRKRWVNHPVLAEINHAPRFWAMRWFLPIASSDLRIREREYIQRFNPPWNINGRRRGFANGNP
jgi:hypothetical protein